MAVGISLRKKGSQKNGQLQKSVMHVDLHLRILLRLAMTLLI